MSTTFPTTKDSFTTIVCSDNRNPKDVINNLQDSQGASQTKIGNDGDSNTASFDYKLSEVLTATPDKAVGKVAIQTLKNKIFEDASTSFMDDVDNTKLMKFQISQLTTGTTRTLTIPDANDTLGLLAATQTFTNKTIGTSNLISFNSPQGFLINGQISPTVASNNLTVAIKGMNGQDPSATNPVYIRINNTIRSITAALSVTLNSATNWFNAGSSELATNEIDYFVYLAWDSSNSLIRIGIARVSHLRLYSAFSGTATDAKFGGFNVNPGATDDVEVIGRFGATLSAGAGYTWTVPVFTTSNLIQKPIFESRISTWVPTVTWTGGAAPTGNGSTNSNKYKIKFGTVQLMAIKRGMTAGTTITKVNITTPIDVNFSTFVVIAGYVGADPTQNLTTAFIDYDGAQRISLYCASNSTTMYAFSGEYDI